MNWTAIFEKLLDPYEVKARLFPGLLVLLPAIVYFVVLYGAENPVVAGLGAALVTCGGPYLLSSFVRTWGQRAQERLIHEWGGQPSTILLRHRDLTLPEETKLRYRELISSRLGIAMPSKEEEEADPARADESYAAAADALRPRTNDRKVFPFVFKELVAYGFNRNAYGSRWIGLGVAILVVVAALYHARGITLVFPYLDLPRIDYAHTVVAVLAIAMGLLWCLHFTADTVRLSGFSYSRRLWEALDKMAKKSTRRPRKEAVDANP